MQALMLQDYMRLEMVQAPEPEMGPDDVLARVRACGICGSDVHGLDGSTKRRFPPLIMGHEAAGEVARVGSRVPDLRPGDRVCFDSMISCGHCFYCARGEVNLCDNREVLGVSPGPYRRHGAFAEYVAVPRRIVYPLPGNLSYQHNKECSSGLSLQSGKACNLPTCQFSHQSVDLRMPTPPRAVAVLKA
ncbi:MAG: alcohol dehydrogenase catalytic domain-containing protein, partial [Acidobacteriia bacterium]|nr:alcohol dehydrogenase catalytic domain-containing protein [Terriglobia bacterium]